MKSAMNDAQILSVVADLASTMSALAGDKKGFDKRLAELKEAAQLNKDVLQDVGKAKAELDKQVALANELMAEAESRSAAVSDREIAISDMEDKLNLAYNDKVQRFDKQKNEMLEGLSLDKAALDVRSRELSDLSAELRGKEKGLAVRESELDARAAYLSDLESELAAREADLKGRLAKLASLAGNG